MKFFNCYDNKPKPLYYKPNLEECLVSQSECETSSLQYQLARYGMNTLEARLEQMRGKFGYADCTKCNDFAELQNKYVASVNYFNALPSEIRRKYHDNPEEFYDDIKLNPETALKHNFISKEQYNDIVGVVKNDDVDLTSENVGQIIDNTTDSVNSP